MLLWQSTRNGYILSRFVFLVLQRIPMISVVSWILYAALNSNHFAKNGMCHFPSYRNCIIKYNHINCIIADFTCPSVGIFKDDTQCNRYHMCIKLNKNIYNFNLQCPETKSYLDYSYQCGIDYECNTILARKKAIEKKKSEVWSNDVAEDRRREVEQLWNNYE